ncbi:hypothetical protein [Burkholderia sp. BE12]|uniref:hypothetical protein n=1 Tax=Burkholderia sp. BE12 TaxID=2082394 RepID=UPI00131A32AF|nr:hypothetical protein [Burkholderia sp. BE12]
MHPTAATLALHGCRVWTSGHAPTSGLRIGTSVERGWPLLAWQFETRYWFMISARPEHAGYVPATFDIVPEIAWDALYGKLLREFMETL